MFSDNNLSSSEKKWFFNAALAVMVLLAIFLAFKAINTIKEYSYIGGDVSTLNTITVAGTGRAFAIPDTATLSFSVIETGKTVKEAQDKASAKMNSIIDAVEAMGIEEKDIKTVGYNSYPKYEYRATSVCTGGYCPSGKETLVGYEVSQTVSVKVRDTDKAGEVLTSVGGLGASNMSGLNFVNDDPAQVQADAREEAIADAREKAEVLAEALGVRLGKIVSFNESGGGYPPIAYGYGSVERLSVQDSVAVAPQLPVGENEIISNVSVTYEIR